MSGWKRWGLPVIVVTTAAVAVPSARADCVYVELYVTRENADPIHPLGEDPCRYPTDWGTTTNPLSEHSRTGMPDGAPNGYYFKVGVPIP